MAVVTMDYALLCHLGSAQHLHGHMSSGEEAQAGLYAPYGGGEGLAGKLIEVGPRSTVSWVRGCLSGSKTENVYCIAMNIFVYLCLVYGSYMFSILSSLD